MKIYFISSVKLGGIREKKNISYIFENYTIPIA